MFIRFSASYSVLIKFPFLISIPYCQMPPNIQIHWIKTFYREKKNKYSGKEVQDYKDGSGLQFIKFEFVTGCQEIKIAVIVKL